MFAAREGKSTIGIPKSVGEEFVGKDEDEEDKQAQDSFAFDRASVRRTDDDGRLHVEITNISKSNVCPYLGSEIPDWEEMGLKRDKVYQLLRDPAELRKAAPSFNNLPLLSEHVPVNAQDHQPDLVIGSTGTDAEFAEPYLRNSLVLWAKDFIDAVESGTQKELSSAYRYRADMTPGNYNGAEYDGVMRDIIGNHVALVREGRAGSDVIVGDSALPITEEIIQMGVKLSRKAALAQGALMVFLKPKMAQDAKIDLASVLKGVTAKNYVESKPAIFAGIAKLLDGKLAKDAKLEDVHGFLDSLDREEPAGDEEPEKKDEPAKDEEKDEVKKPAEDEDDTAMDAEGVKNFLKDKISEDDMKALDALMSGAKDADESTPVKEPAKDEEKEEMVPKKAMDAAIKSAIKVAADTATKTQKDIREAENFVRPWVGNIAMAHDSAEGVYRTALGALGKKDVDQIHPAALKHVLEAQPKPNEKKPAAEHIAMDAASVDSFNKRFPGAARIGQA
jgi:hypothetical protein